MIRAVQGTTRYFIQIMRSKQMGLGYAVLVGLISAGIGVLLPWFSKVFVDEVLINENKQYLLPLLLFWLFFECVRSFGTSMQKVYTQNVTGGLIVDSGAFILRKIHRCAKLIFKESSPGKFITNIDDVANSGATLVDIINEMTEIVVYLAAIPFIFLIIDLTLSLIVGTTVVSCVLVSTLLSRIIKNLHTRKRRAESLCLESTLASIEKTFFLKSYRLEKKMLDEILVQSYRIRDLGYYKTLAGQTSRVINRLIFSLGWFFYRLISAYLVFDGAMTIGDYFAYNVVLSLLFSPIELLTALVGPAQEMIVNSRRTRELLEFPEQSDGAEHVHEAGDVALENVMFSYDRKNILNNVSFVFKTGILYGLVGVNGSGKSTLLQLIARHYDTDGGTIRFGRWPVRDYKRDEYHSRVNYLTTEGFVFPSGIRKNIVLDGEFNESLYHKLIKDLKMANILHRFSDQDELYFGGVKVDLSSGERQKISLARALYRAQDIYLYDEAFSFLDVATRTNITSIIKTYLGQKIHIIVSHDVSILEKLDYLLILDEGQIVDHGRTKDIIQHSKAFIKYIEGVG
ncbi:MAG: ABC transporter ATP-binding protein [Deltaproteobacteria bacterium]|nr:ABC transporter ATP-binding protein [Deltaproteobacteria bacterium]